MIVPQPGWAEHRADEDWWGDLVAITRELLTVSGVEPGAIIVSWDPAIGLPRSPMRHTLMWRQ